MTSSVIPASVLTLFLLFLSPALTVSAELIRDSDGELLQNGGAYYIVPALLGTGGLRWAPNNGSSPCPLFVSEGMMNTDGTPIRVASPILTLHISTGYPVSLTFEVFRTPCRGALAWSVSEDEETNSELVVAGDGENLADDKFRVESTGEEGVYQLTHCPANVMIVCLPLGILDNHLLGVNFEVPLKFKFVKVGLIPWVTRSLM